jgi:hypothetical protein
MKLRAFLGLSPDLEEGPKRQKHGDVVLEPLPEGITTCSMAGAMGRVVCAVVARWTPIPGDPLAQLATAGIEPQSARDQAILLEDLVTLCVPSHPKTVSSRNERVASTGFFPVFPSMSRRIRYSVPVTALARESHVLPTVPLAQVSQHGLPGMWWSGRPVRGRPYPLLCLLPGCESVDCSRCARGFWGRDGP